MHHKNIKLIIKKQLKKEYPNWKKLPHKEKKAIAKKVLDVAKAEYDFSQEIEASLEELVGVEEQVSTDGIMSLEEIAEFIKNFNGSRLIKLEDYKRSAKYLQDEELCFIDKLLDDEIINKLLAYGGYSPVMRDLHLHNLFRAELLKAIKYPEVSYRKFCGKEYMGMDRKQNRVFMGLPLNTNEIIDHTELSQFRAKLSFTNLANLMVYILHHFYQSGLLGDCVLHGIDSTELANDCKVPLASIEVNGKKIRIYNDLDCDSGKRRNKRDKSPYVVGYRLHTLTAINAKTGHSFPLVSLLAPANHHDSLFLLPLIKLAQAMGIEMKLITADDAYHDNNGSFFEETGVYLTKPPSSKTVAPNHVDVETKSVFFDGMCDIPMQHVGCEGQAHEYKCEADSGECPRSQSCLQYRTIPFDSGHFQRISNMEHEMEPAQDIRKNSERPFNLFKNQTGLEKVRVRSQHGLLGRSVFSNIGILLLEMVGARKKKKVVKQRQDTLFENAA